MFLATEVFSKAGFFAAGTEQPIVEAMKSFV